MKYLLGIVFSLMLVSPTLAWDKSPARLLVWTEVCEEFYQPIYGMIERPASGAEVFTGFLIGGAIGNQFGSGSGKDAMTVLGAFSGADQASQRKREKVVIRYERKTRCHWEYR